MEQLIRYLFENINQTEIIDKKKKFHFEFLYTILHESKKKMKKGKRDIY